MLKENFLERLGNSYKDSNETKIEDLSDWIDRCNISPEQLSMLYEEVVEGYTYKTFPTLAEIKKYWTGVYSDPPPTTTTPIFQQRINSRTWDIKKILTKISHLKNKSNLQSHEIDFIAQWSDLWSEYHILIDKEITGLPMKKHLEYVKNAINRQEKIDSIFKNSAPVEILEERKEKAVPIWDLL